jgi:hypothetical protein
VIGVIKIPKKLPKAELNTAAASLPPTALVKITADDTGGGIQLKVKNLKHKKLYKKYVYKNSILTQSLKLYHD